MTPPSMWTKETCDRCGELFDPHNEGIISTLSSPDPNYNYRVYQCNKCVLETRKVRPIKEEETTVEKYLKDRIEALGGKAYKFSSPSNRGVPDRLCILPGNVIFFVECKAVDGSTRKLQKKEAKILTDLGCTHFFARSKKEVDRLIDGI